MSYVSPLADLDLELLELNYECPHCNESVSEVLTCPNCHRELGLECCMPAGVGIMCLACEEELLADAELKDEEW